MRTEPGVVLLSATAAATPGMTMLKRTQTIFITTAPGANQYKKPVGDGHKPMKFKNGAIAWGCDLSSNWVLSGWCPCR
jgi:hypothetical protein